MNEISNCILSHKQQFVHPANNIFELAKLIMVLYVKLEFCKISHSIEFDILKSFPSLFFF